MLIERDKEIKAIDILNAVYPVGSIYMSVNNTSPESFIGGTWESLQNRFLIGAGGNYSAGSEGGEANHNLTVDELPSHSHGLNSGGRVFALYTDDFPADIIYSQGFTGASSGWWSLTNKNETSIASTGGGAAHNNLPPYLAVYMWKRTA